MSTRCNIAIHDSYDLKNPGARLYHHCDGYPSFMVKKLTDFLDYIAKIDNYKFNFDSESVAAMMIVLSIEDYEVPMLPFSTDRLNTFDLMRPDMKYRANNGLPVFDPCIKNHGDIAYTYKVVLNNDRTFKITSRKV